MIQKHLTIVVVISAIVTAQGLPVAAQTATSEYREEANTLAAHPTVVEAFSRIEALDAWSLDRLIELTEIPAPPFMEAVRGQRFAEHLVELGADSVWTDAVGNVIGLRRGRSGERTIGFGGHLDTVFPEGTDVTVRQVGDTLFAPGIGDDTRGLVLVLTVLRAMEEAGVETEDDVWFVGVVGEEGLGDLRGMKHIYREGADAPDAWIEVDAIPGGKLSARWCYLLCKELRRLRPYDDALRMTIDDLYRRLRGFQVYTDSFYPKDTVLNVKE